MWLQFRRQNCSLVLRSRAAIFIRDRLNNLPKQPNTNSLIKLIETRNFAHRTLVWTKTQIISNIDQISFLKPDFQQIVMIPKL